MPKFQTILSIDSAMNGCGAGVWAQGGKIAVAETMAMERGQAEELMPLVERVMKKAGISYDDLDAVAATVGPGTFTGLRVGLSAAKALGLALDIPVLGFSTLDILAEQAGERPCAILIETKREDFYFQMFDGGVSEPAALSAGEIATLIRDRDLLLAGDCLARFMELEPQPGRKRLDIVLPDPLVLCRLAAGGQGIRAPEPLYLRAPDTTMAKKPLRVLGNA